MTMKDGNGVYGLGSQDLHTFKTNHPNFPPGLDSIILQARHRDWSLGLACNSYNQNIPENLPFIIAIGGGKGGVGKSVVSANLSSRLAMNGYRTLVVDLDLGCSNLHTHFSQSLPERTLSDALVRKLYSVEQAILKTNIPNLFFAAAGREELWSNEVQSQSQTLAHLMSELLAVRQNLGIECLVLDLGAGTQSFTLDFFLMSHLGISVVLPEPTSIENAYVFMRATMWQLLQRIMQQLDPALATEVHQKCYEVFMMVGPGKSYPSYIAAFQSLAVSYPDFMEMFRKSLHARSFGILVNQARQQSDIDIGFAMEHICKSYFSLDSLNLGALNYDESVWRSLRNRKLLVVDFPHSLVVKKLDHVIQRCFAKFNLRRS